MAACGSTSQSDKLDAADYFDRTGKTAYHRNQFGATIGGPFWKNKLFFFADTQATLISSYVDGEPEQHGADSRRCGMATSPSCWIQPTRTAMARFRCIWRVAIQPPTAGGTENPNGPQRYLTCNGVQNVICPNQINPVAQRILNLFPAPNQGGPHQAFQNYTIPPSAATNNTTQYDLRLDFNPTSKDQAFGRYSYSNNPSDSQPPFGILDGGGFGSRRTQ